MYLQIPTKTKGVDFVIQVFDAGETFFYVEKGEGLDRKRVSISPDIYKLINDLANTNFNQEENMDCTSCGRLFPKSSLKFQEDESNVMDRRIELCQECFDYRENTDIYTLCKKYFLKRENK